MQNASSENSHVSPPQIDRPQETIEPAKSRPQTDSVAERLVPCKTRERKFRSHSFLAKLTPLQHQTLILWLKALSTSEIVEKVAAPPPEGFGLKVCATTIDRTRVLFRNVPPMNLATEALDTAADLLESHQTAAIPALHEALHLMLYSTALHQATHAAEPKTIDQTLTALIRLERLRILATAPARNHSYPASRHNIQLTITPVPAEHPNASAQPWVGQAPRPTNLTASNHSREV